MRGKMGRNRQEDRAAKVPTLEEYCKMVDEILRPCMEQLKQEEVQWKEYLEREEVLWEDELGEEWQE